MRHLFLYGDLAQTFDATCRPFVAAAGGTGARVALLLMGGPGTDEYLPRYVNPMLAAGAAAVTPLVPDDSGRLPADAAAVLQNCSGIFMGGGFTARYQALYVTSPLGTIIRERYAAGVPYGGISAGALLGMSVCPAAGNVVATAANTYRVRSLLMEEPVPLALGEGLGLMPDFMLEVHCAEWGSFPRLAATVEGSGVSRGMALDAPVCLEIRNEKEGLVHGQGRAYYLRRGGAPRRFDLQVLEPGDHLML